MTSVPPRWSGWVAGLTSYKFSISKQSTQPLPRGGTDLVPRILLQSFNQERRGRPEETMLPNTLVSWYVFISREMSTHGTPKGNLICEAAFNFQTQLFSCWPLITGYCLRYNNSRDINSARLLTPNLMKM